MEKIKYIAQNPTSSSGKIVGLLILVLIAGGVLASTLRDGLNAPITEVTNQPPPENIANKALIYGNWAADSSQIFAYDLANQKEYILATLPINVKKINILNQDELLYINNTNKRDHGSEIVIYSVSDKQARVIYTADNEFGIDDYVLSPDKSKIAVWEVRFTQENILRNGDSRVYTTDIQNPNVKYVIATEISNTPVLYPLAITDNGEVFMDRFIPNDGAGWAYGMSVSDFFGNQLTPLENMQAGSYGTQPALSKDGSTLVFGGYDGSLGDGNEEEDGYRRALLSTNTVETLSTITKERTRLPLPSDNIYSSVEWEENGDIHLTILSSNPSESGTFLYNINSQSLKSVDLEAEISVIATLPSNVTIEGKQDDSSTFLGNLGDGYESPYTQIQADIDGEIYEISTSATLNQIIGITELKNLNTQLLTTTESQVENQVQLRTFEVKPTLEEKRLEQQSDPPTPTDRPEFDIEIPIPTPPKKPLCKQLILTQCNKVHNANISDSDYYKYWADYNNWEKVNKGKEPTEKTLIYGKCMATQYHANVNKTCTDSPLYLYGPEGLKVDIKIHTPIFESNIPGNGSYTFTLGKNGLFSSEGISYDSLSFDYQAQGNVRPPIYGSIVKKEKTRSTVAEYAQQLGLNKREAYDLIHDIESKATSPYVFVSFYDQPTSKYLLPISFEPVPDTYINYVFVIKNLSTPQELGYTPQKPKFEKTQRVGDFVAVEISVVGE